MGISSSPSSNFAARKRIFPLQAEISPGSGAVAGGRQVDVELNVPEQRLQLLGPFPADQLLKRHNDSVGLGFEAEELASFFEELLRDIEGRPHKNQV
jgi:hypothetical protein